MYKMVGFVALLLLCGCGRDRFEIRPNPDKCVESAFAVHTEVDRLEGKSNSNPLSVSEVQALALRPANLERALGKRKYIVHYYQRLADKDVELNPAKFPLFWDIDSTAIQTEGTFLVHFQDDQAAQISFQCKGCIRIDTAGQVIDAKHAELETEMEAKFNSKQCSPDWCFSLRPRKIPLTEEIGKDYIVRIESRKSYLATAKDRIQVENGNGYAGTFAIRFRDPLEYRATNFLRELGIAMALSDKEDREAQIVPRLDSLESEILKVKQTLDSLRLGTEMLEMNSNGVPAQRSPSTETLFLAQTQAFAALEKEREHLLMEKNAVLPRLLVISPALPCRQ